MNSLVRWAALAAGLAMVPACGGGGDGGGSSPGPVAPPGSPAAPADFGVVSGDQQAVATWSPSAGATSYNFYWGTFQGISPSTGTKVAGVASPYTHLGLTNGTRYTFILTAENASGESLPTGEVTVIPPPAVPSDFSLEDVNANSPTSGQMVARSDYAGFVSGWYFGTAT